MTEVFDAFGSREAKSFNMLFLVLAEFPLSWRLPTPRSKLIHKLNDTRGEVADALLTKSKKEKEAGTLDEREEKSILGLLSMLACHLVFDDFTQFAQSKPKTREAGST